MKIQIDQLSVYMNDDGCVIVVLWGGGIITDRFLTLSPLYLLVYACVCVRE